jgi:hypothetical protein
VQGEEAQVSGSGSAGTSRSSPPRPSDFPEPSDPRTPSRESWQTHVSVVEYCSVLCSDGGGGESGNGADARERHATAAARDGPFECVSPATRAPAAVRLRACPL